MTDRFTVVDLTETLAIAENDECKYYQNNDEDFKRLCKRLNELDTFRTGYFELEKIIGQLRDENHRLRMTKIHISDLKCDLKWLKEHWGEKDD